MDRVINIPSPRTSFIGRADEIREIASLLTAPGCHLLTLVGAGGAGKTRLSIEVARQLGESFADGVHFVSLAAAKTIDDVVTALIDAVSMEISKEPVSPAEALLGYLESRHLLLVIDNFEHLLDSASLLGDIIARAPEVRLLVTSRGALNLQEEWVRHLEGMDMPNGGRPEESGAVQLFLNRAGQVRRLDTLDIESVIRICRLVDGMPLAIELSAGWVNALTPADIAAEIERNIDILTSTRQNVEERHRSMRVVFDQSLALLTDDECALFSKLTVFSGGFAREAAQAVCDASLPALAMLVNKSLVHLNADGRYDIHELLRQYAGDPEPAVHERHMRYFLGMLANAPLLSGGQLEAVNQMEQEIENIRWAWEWAVEMRSFDAIHAAAENLSIYCDMRTQYPLGIRLLRMAFHQAGEPLLASQLQAQIVRLVVLGGVQDPMDVKAELTRCMEIARSHQSAQDEAFVLYLMGMAAMMSRWPDPVNFVASKLQQEVVTPMREAAERFKALGDRHYQADALTWMAWGEMNLDQLEAALKHLEQSLAIHQELGDRHGAAWVMHSLGKAYYGELRYEEFEARIRQSAEIMAEFRSIKGIVMCQDTLAGLAMSHGDFDEARQHAREMLALSRSVNHLEGELSALGMLSILAAMDEDWVTSESLARQSRAINDRAVWVNAFPLAHAGLSFAACGLGNFAEMRENYKKVYHHSYHLDPIIISMILGPEIVAQAQEGNLVSAVELMGLAQRIPPATRKWMSCWPLLVRVQADLAEGLDPETYSAAWERGQRLDLGKTLAGIARVQEEPDIIPAPTPNEMLPEPLTERENEILHLVAAGLSNLEIAEQLVLSVGTVKVHTKHIYQKLGVGSRTQAIARASEIHLIK